MSTLSENIKSYRKSSKLTQKELANQLDVAATAVSAWELGRNKPLMDNIEKMSHIFNIKKSELLGDTLNELSNYDSNTTQTAQKPPDLRLVRLTDNYTQLNNKRRDRLVMASDKLVKEQEKQKQAATTDNVIDFSQTRRKYYDYDFYDNAVSAGTGQYLGDGEKESISLPIDIDADFVVPVKGDSMEPDYNDEDYAFIKSTVHLSNGDVGVFLLDGEAYIKQLIIKKDHALLHSLNANGMYPDITVDANSDVRVIGKVVDVYRK